MIGDEELAKRVSVALGEVTLDAGPEGIDDCRHVAKKMIGTCLATIAVNTDFATAMQDLGEVVRHVSEQLGVGAQVDVLEVPCSAQKH